MDVCVCVCVCVHARTHIHTHMYPHTYIYTHAGMTWSQLYEIVTLQNKIVSQSIAPGPDGTNELVGTQGAYLKAPPSSLRTTMMPGRTEVINKQINKQTNE